MASGIFAVLDDIAMLMDDVVLASKIATKKTAGILGDDLAVNAEKATGFVSSREIPVLWAITKGSFINKLIIVPLAFILNVIFPPAIIAALLLGGIYLAYEGVEKILHWIFHRNENHHHTVEEPHPEDSEETEKAKIKSAVSTDFILSVEIVIIALGTVLDKPLVTKILTVSVVAFVATVGVYGLVAMIVRMDDIGYSIISKSKGKGFVAKFGQFLVNLLPKVIRLLSVVGTIALILVAGGIFAHNIDFLHHLLPHQIPSIIQEAIIGIIVGLIAVGAVTIIKKSISSFRKTES
jgi:uncharacterized protein